MHVGDPFGVRVQRRAMALEAEPSSRRRALSAGLLVFAGYLATTAVLVGAGLLLVHAPFLDGLRHFDDNVSQWVADHRSSWLNAWVLRVGRIADTVPVVVAAVVICA